jgi:hypothetical protein
MRFSGWQSLRRNWLVGVIGLLVTIGLVGAVASLVPANYVATSQLVLLPPLSQPNASYNGVVNPYLGLTGLQSMADVVSSAMMGNETAKALQEAGVSQYSVEYDSLSAGPILIAQVTEPSPDQASVAITALDEQVPLTVAHLQGEAAISPRSFITAKVIAGPSTPTRSGKTQLRAAALAFVVGLVLTLLVISVIDGWRVRRRQGSPSEDSYDRTETASAFAETTGYALREPRGATEKPRTAAASPSSDDSGYRVLMNESGHDRSQPPF